jgi:hypothetical protein
MSHLKPIVSQLWGKDPVTKGVFESSPGYLELQKVDNTDFQILLSPFLPQSNVLSINWDDT